jgi:hypothetical protein
MKNIVTTVFRIKEYSISIIDLKVTFKIIRHENPARVIHKINAIADENNFTFFSAMCKIENELNYTVVSFNNKSSKNVRFTILHNPKITIDGKILLPFIA